MTDTNSVTTGGAAATLTAVTATNGGTVMTIGSGTLASTDNLYITGNVPGTYSVRLFQDGNANNVYDSADERSALITLTVYDAGGTGTTSTTGDDVTLALTGTSPADLGNTIPVKATYGKPLSLSDARGSGAGGLGASLAALTVVDVSGTAGLSVVTGAPFVYSATTGLSYTTAATSAPADVTFRGALVATLGAAASTGVVAFGTKTVTVASNLVTALALTETTGQTANVTETNGAEKIRSGTASVSYTATVTTAASDKSGKTVYFILAAGGRYRPHRSDRERRRRSEHRHGAGHHCHRRHGGTDRRVSEDGGYQRLHRPGPPATARTATTRAVAAPRIRSPPRTRRRRRPPSPPRVARHRRSAVRSRSRARSWTQWLVGYNNGGQATLTVTRGGGIGTGISRGVDIAVDGTFSSVVADAAANTTQHNDTYTWTGFGGATGPSSESIFWVTSLNVAAAALTGLGANTTFPVPATFTPTLATHTAMNPINITGTLKDGTAAAVPYAPFTLTGTPGIKFLSSSGVLTSTFTGTANAAGLLSDGTNAYVRVMFTIDGDNSIVVKSGATATATTGTFDTAVPVDAWKISANDAASSPGATIIVTGKITDFFGNGVPAYNSVLDLRLLHDRCARECRPGDQQPGRVQYDVHLRIELQRGGHTHRHAADSGRQRDTADDGSAGGVGLFDHRHDVRHPW